jgi:hypothetical protein
MTCPQNLYITDRSPERGSIMVEIEEVPVQVLDGELP